MQYVRDEIDLTPTLGRLNLLTPADQLALDPKDLAKGPNPAKAPVRLDDVSAACLRAASNAVQFGACCVGCGSHGWQGRPLVCSAWLAAMALAPRHTCCLLAPPPSTHSPPALQLNLVAVLDGPEPKLLPNFDVGPVKLGWSINVDGTYVSGLLE